MHLHLVQFQILDRQALMFVNGVTTPVGSPVPPADYERGWKDTVNVGAGERVRVIATFTDYPGKFAYHCHMLEHEDWDMMRQFEVLAPPGDDAGVAGDGAPDAGAGAIGDKAGGCCDANRRGSAWIALVVVALLARRRRR
jgi:hypothetical protein